MSLNKAIKYGKDHRKPYRKSKAFDRSCRNHGSCSFCEENRTFKIKKSLDSAIEQENEIRFQNSLDSPSPILLDGKIVTVEEWNDEIDRRDESRRINLLKKEIALELTYSYITTIFDNIDNKNDKTQENVDNAFQEILKFYSENSIDIH